jgi:hypothetical protein
MTNGQTPVSGNVAAPIPLVAERRAMLRLVFRAGFAVDHRPKAPSSIRQDGAMP